MNLVPLLDASAQASLTTPVDVGPGTIVHSADRLRAGVVTTPPEGETPPEDAVGWVDWWWPHRDSGWVCAGDITTRALGWEAS